MQTLNKNEMRVILNALGEALGKSGLFFEIVIYGGSSLVLQFEDRPSTRDVDITILQGQDNYDSLQQHANSIGQSHHLPEGWLNDAVKMFTSPKADYSWFGDFPIVGPSSLRVHLASPSYILAMKMNAMRSSLESHDCLDIWNLIDHCDVRTFDDLIAIHQKYFHSDTLSERKNLILQDILEAKSANKTYDPMIGW